MEQYAERLRALHRDLTLVLQAVERGLAAAADARDVEPPVPAHEPIEIVPEPVEEPAAVAARPAPARIRMPRVEVMPAPSGEQRRHDREERREPPPPLDPAPPWGDDEHDGDGNGSDRDAAERVPRPGTRFPARPSAVLDDVPREPEWIEHAGGGFTAPTFPPVGPQRLQVAPVLMTAFALAWLVVVALLVALLVS